ncbi:MAG: GGDEF domain-containing protein [Spirochaetales bacterium]|nr:GGDEF domain-containing protein [Spirochaetales bacterium]
MTELLNNPEIIKHYDLLDKIGLIDYIKVQQLRVNSREELMDQIIELFDKQTNRELTDYVLSLLVDRFIPSHLNFVFQPFGDDEPLEILCYEKMKPVASNFKIDSLKPYSEFFKEYPNTLSFPLFEYKFPDTGSLEELKTLDPEMIVPMLGMNGLYGLIIIGKKMMGDDYTNDEVVYIDRLMTFTAIWLQNNVHYKSSVMDSKTKLFNHSHFSRQLTDDIALYKRYDVSCSLLILDVDFFKKFNDVYGHLAGDMVLYSLARTVEDSVREVDVVARFGGEEFVVLLKGHNKKSSMLVAERIRTSIEKMDVVFQEQVLKVTVSIGVANISPGINFTEDLVSQADAALYQSKKRGRNCSTVYRSGLLARARYIN